MTDMNDSAVSADARAYVYAVIRRILHSDDAANDATQDALLLAHRHRDQFRGDSAVRTWLYRIAVTTALGVLRKARRSREQLVPGGTPVGWDIADDSASPEQQVAARELAVRAADELATLGEIYRGVFELKAREWVEREIARELAISVANVKIRAHRVRRHLRTTVLTPAREAPRPRPGSRAGTTATSRAS